MNWDMIINVGMFGLGCCFVIVAMALLWFGNFDDEKEEIEFYPPELFENDIEDIVQSTHDDISNKLDQVQKDIDALDEPMVASIIVKMATDDVQDMIDDLE
tara:strand:- start:1940 stop:2242 length:303 start_codon:yes stop_codon:yes gene_type:complete